MLRSPTRHCSRRWGQRSCGAAARGALAGAAAGAPPHMSTSSTPPPVRARAAKRPRTRERLQARPRARRTQAAGCRPERRLAAPCSRCAHTQRGDRNCEDGGSRHQPPARAAFIGRALSDCGPAVSGALEAAAAGVAQSGGRGAVRRPSGGASQSMCARAVWRPHMRRWSQPPSPSRTPCLFAIGSDGLWCGW